MTSPDETLFRDQHDRAVLLAYRRCAFAGCIVIAVIAVALAPLVSAYSRVVPLALVSISILLAGVPYSHRIRRAACLTIPLTIALGTIVGYAAGQLGGFEKIGTALLVIVWLLAALVTPTGPVSFATGALGSLVTATLIIFLTAPRPGYVGWYLALTLAGLALLTGAMALRERILRHQFMARRRLDLESQRLADRQAELARLNRELRARVSAQVKEIVSRAADIDALQAHLRHHDRDFSRERELALALTRLGGRGRPFSPGMTLGGRARLVSRIGAGGMGDVFLADDLSTGQRVVVKMLRSRAGMDRTILRRFLAEAAAAAMIDHPAVVRVLHVDVTEEGQLYQIMEHVDGVTLAHGLRTWGSLSPALVARLGEVLASALAAAHAAGVIHRDVKPANIMLSAHSPGVHVLDFGLSKLRPLVAGDDAHQTRPDIVMGTPQYMSPEQNRSSASVTPTTDVYSVGVVLFEALASEHAADLTAILHACLADDPRRRPGAAELAERLGSVADAMLAPAAEEILSVLEATGPRDTLENDPDAPTLPAELRSAPETLES